MPPRVRIFPRGRAPQPTPTAPAAPRTTGGTLRYIFDMVAIRDRITRTFVIDGGGGVISTGQKGHLDFSYNCALKRVRLEADQSGSMVIDIWKDTWANAPPTVADTICASAKPTLSAAQFYEDTTLTGWNRHIAKGDIVAFNVDSCSTITRVTVSLEVVRT